MNSAYDLDLSHYTLDELLGVFKLEHPIGKHSLKQARKIMVHTHPDKSGLDPSVFVFFSMAYNTLERLVRFQNKGKRSGRTEYSASGLDEAQAAVILKDRHDFDEVFNELFEAHMEPLYKQDGHGEWLAGGDDSVTNHTSSAGLEARKSQLSKLVVRNEVKGLGGDIGTELGDSHATGCGTGTLAYDDVRKAYTETVVPVTERDLDRRPHHRTVEALRSSRAADMRGVSLSGHRELLAKQWQAADVANMELAFQLETMDKKLMARKGSMNAQLLLLDQK